MSSEKKSKIAGYFSSAKNSASSVSGDDDENDQLINKKTKNKKEERKLSSSSSPQLVRSSSLGSAAITSAIEATGSTKSKVFANASSKVTRKNLLEVEVEYLKHISELNERISLQQKHITLLEIQRDNQERRLTNVESFIDNVQQHGFAPRDSKNPEKPSGSCFADLF